MRKKNQIFFLYNLNAAHLGFYEIRERKTPKKKTTTKTTFIQETDFFLTTVLLN